SRARFWGEGDDLLDALHTLYDVLVVISKLISPFVPFTAEALYQQLVVGQGIDAPDSVHLTEWPKSDPELLEPSLDADIALARQLCSLGLAARTSSKVKVRQPLQAITIVLVDPAQQDAVHRVSDLIKDELNVRAIRFAADAGAFVDYIVKPDFKKLGRRLGKDMKAVAGELRKMDGAVAHAQLSAGGLDIALPDGRVVALTAEDCQLQLTAKGAYEAASAVDAVVILHTEIDDDLRAEGFVRELTNRVQNLRKQLDLGYTQRIRLAIDGDEQTLGALRTFGDYLTGETLAVSLDLGPIAQGSGTVNDADVDGRVVRIAVSPV
ncbi:MAG: isoleucyl-tRNA synthetase, partial [Kiritimatiellia bacterium]